MMRQADIAYLQGLLTSRSQTITAMSKLIHVAQSEREGMVTEQQMISGILDELATTS